MHRRRLPATITTTPDVVVAANATAQAEQALAAQEPAHEHDQQHVHAPRGPPTTLDGRLLVTREEASQMLGGLSLSTLIRMERRRVLVPVKLSGSAAGKTYYRLGNVVAVAEGAVGGND
jgi:hypothetical protein